MIEIEFIDKLDFKFIEKLRGDLCDIL